MNHQQIVKAVDDSYLTALQNRQTNAINVPIPVIIDYLFKNHGRVTQAMLQQEEKNTKEMFYNPTHPINESFRLSNSSTSQLHQTTAHQYYILCYH